MSPRPSTETICQGKGTQIIVGKIHTFSFSFEPLNKSSCVILGPETGSGFVLDLSHSLQREEFCPIWTPTTMNTHDPALFLSSWAHQMELQGSVVWRPFWELGRYRQAFQWQKLSSKPSECIEQRGPSRKTLLPVVSQVPSTQNYLRYLSKYHL